MSRSGLSAKIRAKATSSAPYSWLTVQMSPTTPMIEAATACPVIASSAPSMRSSSGGNASIRASDTLSRIAVSPAIQPASPRTTSVVGIAAKSDEKARPLASSPPAAWP